MSAAGDADAYHRVSGPQVAMSEADRFEGWPAPWNLAGAEQTAARLRDAGFHDVQCWLQAWPVTADEPRAYLETVCLGPHLERLAPREHERFLDAVMARLGERPVLDYVRLNIVAARSRD